MRNTFIEYKEEFKGKSREELEKILKDSKEAKEAAQKGDWKDYKTDRAYQDATSKIMAAEELLAIALLGK